MNATISPLISARAELLAKVVLTRQPSVVTGVDLGDLDFLVHLYPEDGDRHQAVPAFGVLVYGTDQPAETEDQAGVLANARWHNMVKHRYFTPVLVLLFSMHNDDGYYAWASEPVIHPDTKFPGLVNQSHLDCTKVTNRSIPKVFARIREWYSVLAEIVFEGK
jgi:hypothetical protein